MKAFHALMSRHWAILPSALDMMAEIALRQNSDVEAVAARLGKPLNNTQSMTLRGNTAILPLIGPIFPRANMMTQLSGATSLSVFMNELHTAIEDDQVENIILDVDSPGGVAFGPAEAAELIARAKEIKPIIAYVGGMSASAAYWISAAASEIVAHRTAQLGSIGVVTGVPVQESAGSDGYKTYAVVSTNAKNKRPDPRTDEGLAAIRAELDGLEAEFIGGIAAYRGVSIDKVKTDFGGGGLLIAQDAVRVGMADRLGSFEDVLAELNSRPRAANQVRKSASKSGGIMNTKHESADPAVIKTGEESNKEMTVARVRAQFPEVAAALSDEGREAGYQAGFEAGAKAERTRIAEIDALAMAGHESLVAKAKADGSITASQLALQIVAAQKAAGGAYLANLEAASQSLPSIAPSVEPVMQDEDSSAPLEDRAKAQWQSDAKIRAEFGDNFQRYLSYKKAESNGQVKILKK